MVSKYYNDATNQGRLIRQRGFSQHRVGVNLMADDIGEFIGKMISTGDMTSYMERCIDEQIGQSNTVAIGTLGIAVRDVRLKEKCLDYLISQESLPAFIDIGLIACGVSDEGLVMKCIDYFADQGNGFGVIAVAQNRGHTLRAYAKGSLKKAGLKSFTSEL